MLRTVFETPRKTLPCQVSPLVLLALSLVLTACGQDGGGGGSASGAAANAADTAAALDTTGAANGDSEAAADVAIADLAVADAAALDLGGADGPTKADNATAAVCPGGAGCACSQAGDCDNFLCIQTANGKRCAKPCVSACEAGFGCATINGSAGDVISLCVPANLHLCDPCKASSDCTSLGHGDDKCVPQGAAGSFCATACSADVACPDGYACAEVSSVEGSKSKQCVKKPASAADTFGVCACTALGKLNKAQTTCSVAGSGGNCAGTRQCGESGLSECSAPPASTEVCDGVDNDCDGLVDEQTCADKGACQQGKCDPKGGCVYLPLDGTPCDADANGCTEGDHCVAGNCKAGPAKDCDDKNACTVDACGAATGCTHAPDDGKACDADGSACTSGDLCAGGVCKAGVATDCDDKNPCTEDGCDAKTAACGHTALNVLACDDGSACTAGDACVEGKCKGKFKNCDDGNPCTLDGCDAATGCKSESDEGAACTDDNPCTLGDVCKAAQCLPGKPKVCVAPGACATAACNNTSGKCDPAPKKDGAPCDDDSVCTENDACAGGACTGTAIGCDDGNGCTADACDLAQGCTHTAIPAQCDDGDKCTLNDLCSNKACKAGKPKLCNDNLPCTFDGCNAKTGQCTADLVLANGNPCDADGSVCTADDACLGGACVAGSDLNCEDGNPCTDNPCNDIGGCQKVANAKGCNDGDPCTLNDACKDKTCLSGAPKVCNDKNVCTVDACDSKSGACQFSGSPQDGKGCEDGSPCTLDDTCKAGTCVPGSALNCDDGFVCTDDSCDAQKGCVHAANNGGCTDSDFCTQNEKCVGGVCVSQPLDCNDNNPCTTDKCDPKKGCTHTAAPDGTTCGTAGESCQGGACKTPVPGMTLIPAGDFWMGCNSKLDGGCGGDEAPQHKVALNAFYISINEVTAAEYKVCVNSGLCTEPNAGWYLCEASNPWNNYTNAGRDKHPINCVNWYQAKQYCTAMIAGGRLPTEAEWEKAARGGCEKYPNQDCQAATRTYPWGNDQPSCEYLNTNLFSCGASKTTPVGQFPAGKSLYGVNDMAGNVMEWVQDWKDTGYYAASPPSNPPGPLVGQDGHKVFRGGGWDSGANSYRGGDRDYYPPTTGFYRFGFRCAKDGPAQ